MNDLIPWKAWVVLTALFYPSGKRGNPPSGIDTMLRMILLQDWFNLSDEGLEDSIYGNYAFRNFMGLNFLQEQAPDATTLCKFRALLDETGRIMHGGTIVDATIIDAPSSTKNKDGKRDPEMH